VNGARGVAVVVNYIDTYLFVINIRYLLRRLVVNGVCTEFVDGVRIRA
jgi:hypothetical protein